jgi:glutaminase
MGNLGGNALKADVRPICETPSALERYLELLHRRLVSLNDGAVATYIPELGAADRNDFAVAIATLDGHVHHVGNVDRRFTIQSVSKPFMYALALHDHGRERVLERVGVEPTGEAFNAILLDEVKNRPFNPMVNAGAIAVAAMVDGVDAGERERRMLEWLGAFAGRKLDIDQEVWRSEDATGHRNRAIAYLMLNFGMIDRPPAEVLDLYFQQCSVRVTCDDLAVMAATLANRGVNPVTGDLVVDPVVVRDVLSVMSSCGMYDYAGQWVFDVGFPAKSGVSGGIVVVIPGQAGIAVYSPPLDSLGNSVRGIAACRAISTDFGLHPLAGRADLVSVIRGEFRGDAVGSTRRRTVEEQAILEREGKRIAVIELQGALIFGTMEHAIRRASELAEEADVVILDFKRVHAIDHAAVKLIEHMSMAPPGGADLVFVELANDASSSPQRLAIRTLAEGAGVRLFPELDAALEWAEARLLEATLPGKAPTALSLARLEMFQGLSTAECKTLERMAQPFRFEKGQVIVRQGDAARLLFVVGLGTVSVWLNLKEGRRRRIACIGPGLSFGEMALLDGGRRSADIVADETAICYGFAVAGLQELGKEQPNIMMTILANLSRDLSARLRRANQEIMALD